LTVSHLFPDIKDLGSMNNPQPVEPPFGGGLGMFRLPPEVDDIVAEGYRAYVRALNDRIRRDVSRSPISSFFEIMRQSAFGFIAGLVVLVSVGIGGWALTGLLASEISSQVAEINNARVTLERLKEQTWGIRMEKDTSGKRFIVLPPGTRAEPGWTYGDRPALRVY
jgi:hypothetical protein